MALPKAITSTREKATCAMTSGFKRQSDGSLVPNTGAYMAAITGYAQDWAGWWSLGHQEGRRDRGRDWLKQELYKVTFADEFYILIDEISQHLGAKPNKLFKTQVVDDLLKKHPRDQQVFEDLLKTKLAMTPSGEHIDGQVGTSVVSGRLMGKQWIQVESRDSLMLRTACRRMGLRVPPRTTTFRVAPLRWHIYAGEEEERERIRQGERDYEGAEDQMAIDRFETAGGMRPDVFMANHPEFSAESVIAGLDAACNLVDEGAAAGYVQGRTGAQPVDPDAATTGTLLFSCEGSDPFWVGAVDDTDGSCSNTADTVSDDTSADATNTLGYCRISAADTSITELDNHIDGEAGTSSADWTFNTLSIVSGSTVSITSIVVGQSQGDTAT